jgi:hypothetical protein
LNRRLAGLDLPASEIGSVVGNGQLDIVHRPGIIARVTRWSARSPGSTLRCQNLKSAVRLLDLPARLGQLARVVEVR